MSTLVLFIVELFIAVLLMVVLSVVLLLGRHGATVEGFTSDRTPQPSGIAPNMRRRGVPRRPASSKLDSKTQPSTDDHMNQVLLLSEHDELPS
jgi:hypothetical protein